MNNKIYRLQNRLKNKEIEVAKLTEKIVDNELKLRESFRCSLFTVLITLVSVAPAFLIAKFVPSLYILGVPFLITGSYIMSYSVMEIYDAITIIAKMFVSLSCFSLPFFANNSTISVDQSRSRYFRK